MGERRTIKIVSRGATTAVALVGDVDMDDVAQLRADLAEIGEEASVLEVDASGLEYLHRGGVDVLVAVHNRICARGGEGVRIMSPQPRFALQLSISNLDALFEVVG